MNNPWLKLATLSLFSLIVIVVLLWGINSVNGYNQKRAGLYYNQYPIQATYPYGSEFQNHQLPLPQGAIFGRPSAGWPIPNQSTQNSSQLPPAGIYQPNHIYNQYQYGNHLPPVNTGVPQNHFGNGPVGTWGYNQGMGNTMGMMNGMQDMDHMMRMMNEMQHMNEMMQNMNGMGGVGNSSNMQGNSGNKSGGMGMM